MTRKTNRYHQKKRNERIALIILLLIIAVLVSLLVYQHFNDKKDDALGGASSAPSGSAEGTASPAPTEDPVWFENSAPADNTIRYTPPEGVEYPYYIKVNRALYQARLLSADLVPSFSANASAAASHNIDNGNAARSYQTEFGVSYEVDLWQKLRNAANAQEWEYKATMEDREAARLALVNSVADTYFELKYLDESIKVMDASVKRYQDCLLYTSPSPRDA